MNGIADFLKAVIKRKYILIAAMVVCAAISMLIFKYVPKKYKTSTVISIQNQYFQNSLVRDFIPEPSESSELRGARETLIRHALNHEFMREIGVKYNFIKNSANMTPTFKGVEETANFEDEMSNSFELELLLQRFEIIGAGPGSFLIGFSANDPVVSYRVINDAINRIRQTMTAERHESLERLRMAIEDRIEALSFGKNAGLGPVAASKPELLKSQVTALESELAALKLQYSDRHPKVIETEARLAEMKKWLAMSSSSMARESSDSSSSMMNNSKLGEGSSKELFQDLLKKFHYLEIVIALDDSNPNGYMTVVQEPTMPHSALWPKRSIFLIWGVSIGFLLGSLMIFFLELTEATPVWTKVREFFLTEQSA
jgi:uncharacterized protein involved in exopolysaccharide biosynthesis